MPDADAWYIYYRCCLSAWQRTYLDAEIGRPCHPTIIAYRHSRRPAGPDRVARSAIRMTTAHLTGLPVVWSEDCLRHDPAGEVWLGVWEPGTELPERASVLLAALTKAGASVTDARRHEPDALLAVHDAELVEHLASIWALWEAGGYVSEYGRSRVV